MEDNKVIKIDPLMNNFVEASKKASGKEDILKEANGQPQSAGDTKPLSTSSDKTEGCGYGTYRPGWLQILHNPQCLLVCLTCCSITQGLAVNGFIPVSLSTLEKRFKLTSTESGFFASFYDISVIFGLLPVSHFGGKGNKPRWLGIGVLIMGLGSFICALPQFFLKKPYRIPDLSDVCILTSSTNSTNASVAAEEEVRLYYYVLLFGQLFHGLGASPLYTLGITYLDESVAQTRSAVYLSYFQGLGVLGPATGFILGGSLLRIYGDIDKQAKPKDLSPEDPRWYGAWWIGFIISGFMGIALSLPSIAFAKRLPGAKEHRKRDIDQAHGSQKMRSSKKLVDMPKTIWFLCKNAPYVLVTAMISVEAFLLNGFVNFIPKMLENFFSMSTSESSFISGAVIVPGGVLGSLIGGYTVSSYKLRIPQMAKMAIVCHITATFLVLGFLIVCPPAYFAGVNKPFNTSASTFVNGFTDPCNQNCTCSQLYSPVCNRNSSLVYFSPCHAGCLSPSTNLFHDTSGITLKQWEKCKCIVGQEETTVVQGFCPMPCKLVGLFLFLCAIQISMSFVASMPVQQFQLRCVPFEHRTLALSFAWIFVRLLGSVPGPIIVGKVIDKACTLWKLENGKESVCFRYDSEKMARDICLIGVVLKLMIVGLLVLANHFYRSEYGNDAEPKSVHKDVKETSLKVSKKSSDH